MNIFFEEHQKVLTVLIEHKVHFMLIGGYAVNYHGYSRTTGDMDVWIKPDNENKLLLLQALLKLGFDEAGIKEIESWDFTKPQLFHILDKPYRTDFLTYVSGIKYTEAEQEIIKGEFEGMLVPFININHLIRSKQNTGRLKDQADIEYLNKIILLKNKK
jgi:predicted nucleotidyltransferase